MPSFTTRSAWRFAMAVGASYARNLAALTRRFADVVRNRIPWICVSGRTSWVSR